MSAGPGRRAARLRRGRPGTRVATPVNATNAVTTAASTTRERSDSVPRSPGRAAGSRARGPGRGPIANTEQGRDAARGRSGTRWIAAAGPAGEHRGDEEGLERARARRSPTRSDADPGEQHDDRQQPGDQERVGALDEPRERDEDDRHERRARGARGRRTGRGSGRAIGSRRGPGGHRRGWYVRRGRLCRRPRRAGPRADSVLSTFARLHPRAARLVDAPAHVVELLGPVGVGVDREDAAHRDRAARTLGGEVEAVRRAVDLERGAGRGGRLEHGVPVEVEVVAGLDHPARRVGDDVDVRAADRVQRAPRELGARLAAGDVDRGDDEVEAGEEVVVVVEVAVRPHLELAAVEQPEAARVRARRARSPAASSAANRAFSAAMIPRSCSTRSGSRPRAMPRLCEWSVRTW